MRVFVDIGWMQERIDVALLEALDAIVKIGGPSLDLRMAIDGTNQQLAVAVRDSLCGAVPASAITAYSLPAGIADQPGSTENFRDELRRLHAEAVMPDVALTIWGGGGEGIPPDLPVVDWCPDEAEGLMAALAEAYKTSPRPNLLRDDALDVLTDALRKCGSNVDVEDLGGALIRSARLGEESGSPRLLIDVSYITTIDHGTGIQRVVHNLTKSLFSLGAGRRFESVELVAARQPDRTELCYVSQIGDEPRPAVRIRTGDTLLMLDAAWEAFPNLVPYLKKVRRYGGRVITTVYDIVPLRRRDLVPDSLPPVFERWFLSAVEVSDALVCISKTVADDVVSYIREKRLNHRDGLRIGWWYLGSNLPVHVSDSPSQEVAEMLDDDTPTFLMVGTVEPRKQHVVALDAVELLWERGIDLKLLILGREGWNVSDFVRRLREHEEAGKRLLWKPNASDADIQHAYKGAKALLFPSVLEGFGLPIVEAAIYGLGSICSDIASLREIGGKGLIYVPVGDKIVFANAIEGALEGRTPDQSYVQVLSWDESARKLLEILDQDRYEHVLRT